MADVAPKYALERKKIQVQIGQLKQNVLASELRALQLQTELDQIEENVAATERAIAEQQAALDALPTEE